MSVITSMLHSESTRRPTAQDLLDNKTLQIRGQDYQLRYSFALAKQKNDSLLKNIRDIDQKSKDLTKSISNIKIDKNNELNLDNQINEIKRRFEQIKFRSKRPSSTSNKYNNNGNKNSFKFEDDINMTPLKSLDTNTD